MRIRPQLSRTGHVLANIRVRREALTIRAEVRDLPPLTLSQQGGEAGGSLTREAPGGWEQPRQSRDVPVLPDGVGPASMTKRSTRGTSVITSLKGWPAQIWRIRAGSGAYLIRAAGSGNFWAGMWMCAGRPR